MLRAAGGASKHTEAILYRPLRHINDHGASTSSGRRCLRPFCQIHSSARIQPSAPTSIAAPISASNTSDRPSLSGIAHGIDSRSLLRRYSTWSSLNTNVDPTEPEAEPVTLSRKGTTSSVNTEGVQERFQRLGLNANISRQITLTQPNILQPTAAQAALVPAILSPTDVILRAHTGTGKSFGILLALLSKPRIVFREHSSQGPESSAAVKSKNSKTQTGIASIILVPSNELAFQYLRWTRSLFPPSSLPSLDPVIQCLVRGGLPGAETLTPEEELKRLKSTPPHILIGTPGRIKDILDTPAGSSLLGLDTLRTLVLDEADAVLQLPGRFPSHKQRWKHEVHKAPGLLVLNAIMKRRATYSGGEKHLAAGLENRPGKRKDEKRPPEHVRRNAYKAAEQSSSTDPVTGLAVPKARGPGVHPLQLVATSATANSVMRHFFAARTGWLRTGVKENGLAFSQQVGRWIDLTGLSGQSMVDQGIRGLYGANERSRTESLIQTTLVQAPTTMPTSIRHACVVVDEAPLSKQLAAVPLRNFAPKLARKKSHVQLPTALTQSAESEASGPMQDEFVVIKPEGELQEHEMDQTLIEALAFCFASEGVDRGLALIPARWSLLKTRAALEALGVSVRLASDVSSHTPKAEAEAASTSASSTGPELFLLQATSSRGLDIPALSHVFLLGYAAVIDAVQYIHSAGRVARIGGDPNVPSTGKVVTLLRGIPHDTPLPADLQGEDSKGTSTKAKVISTSEAKMANTYRRLGVVPEKFDLGLLTTGAAAAAATQAETSESTPDAFREEAPAQHAAEQANPPSSST